MAATIRGCRERGYRVVCAGHSHLSAHGQDDLGFSRTILERAGPQDHPESPVCSAADTPDALRSIYRNADIVVGTRMHSCILSLVEGVPALALAYQPKTTGLYSALGLGDWCGDVGTVDSETLLAEIEELLGNRDEARQRVREAVDAARSGIVATYLPGGDA
jgi:colanic acid/amylovoran biosynthesis protein